MHTGEFDSALRKVMDVALRILIAIIIIGMLAYQVSARNYFWELYDQGTIDYGDWGDTLLIYRISPFLIAMAIFSLLRQRLNWPQDGGNHTVRNRFWLAKVVIWCAAFLYWGTEAFANLIRNRNMSVSIWLFYEETGFLVVKHFGETLFLVYLVEMLYNCWPELKKEWCADHLLIRKVLMSVKIVFFDRISRARTMKGKVFAVVECVFFVYAVSFNRVGNIIYPYAYLESTCGIFTWISTAVMYIPYNHLWPFAILQLAKNIIADDL